MCFKKVRSRELSGRLCFGRSSKTKDPNQKKEAVKNPPLFISSPVRGREGYSIVAKS
tara:strand:- start:316 stop:486 length:171 start_codon:yes stop_codon:yes gene_type:complete